MINRTLISKLIENWYQFNIKKEKIEKPMRNSIYWNAMLSAMHGYGNTFKRGTDYFYLEHLGFIS